MGKREERYRPHDMEAVGVRGVPESPHRGIWGRVPMEIWREKTWAAGQKSDGYGGQWTTVASSIDGDIADRLGIGIVGRYRHWREQGSLWWAC